MKQKKEFHVGIEELEQEAEPFYKGPLKVIFALFVVLIFIMMIIPYYSLKVDPAPRNIPSLSDVLPEKFNVIVYNSSSYYENLHPEESVVKEVANKVVIASCNNNDICSAKALFYFVRDNFKYVGEGRDYIMSSSEMFSVKGDDCDGHAVLLANLLQAVGLNTRFVFVPNHVLLQVWLPDAAKRYKVSDDWIYLDPTCQSCSFGELPQQYVDSEKRFSE